MFKLFHSFMYAFVMLAATITLVSGRLFSLKLPNNQGNIKTRTGTPADDIRYLLFATSSDDKAYTTAFFYFENTALTHVPGKEVIGYDNLGQLSLQPDPKLPFRLFWNEQAQESQLALINHSKDSFYSCPHDGQSARVIVLLDRQEKLADPQYKGCSIVGYFIVVY